MADDDQKTEEPENEEVVDEATLGQFEFIDRTPTPEEVIALLDTLPPVWGVEYRDFAGHVIPLPSFKKVKVQREGRTVEEGHNVVTLYFGVSGRIKMCQAAAEANDWEVDFTPEPNTPHGPGFLTDPLGERIVYREYVSIAERTPNGPVPLGIKPGMAWVPSSGGRQAAGSNPYEKVETAARGRALAAWGFGVIPGSGVASLEEMQATAQNRAALQAERTAGVMRATGRKDRSDLLEELRTLMEEVRQLSGRSVEEMYERMEDYARRAFDVDLVESRDGGGDIESLNWAVLKDGQIQLAINQLRQTKAKLVDVGPSEGDG